MWVRRGQPFALVRSIVLILIADATPPLYISEFCKKSCVNYFKVFTNFL